MTQDEAELNALLPDSLKLKIAGETVVLKPLQVKNLKKVLEIMKPMASYFPSIGATPEKEPIDFMGLVINHTDTVVQLIALFVDKSEEWVGDLNIAELIDILSAIVEMNLDFFTQRVLPSVSQAMGRLVLTFEEVKALRGSGLTPSKV